MQVRTQFRKIFTQMGFEEMPTNNYVESSFWNFDALFQPQQHPARDAHDTFFLTSECGLASESSLGGAGRAGGCAKGWSDERASGRAGRRASRRAGQHGNAGYFGCSADKIA